MEDAVAHNIHKRKESTPPDGYVCRLCSVKGHWIQVCPTKKTGKRKRKPKHHTPVPGKDPSPEDIAEAQKMQAIHPPKCFCGVTSRLNKVKRSKAGGESSRALGKYFFFCSKKRDDETQCRFARPAELELNKMKARAGNKAAQQKTAEKEKRESTQIKKVKVEQEVRNNRGNSKVGTKTARDDCSSSSSSSSSSSGGDVVREKDFSESDSSSDGSSSDDEVKE